jgi:hypothetical protein
VNEAAVRELAVESARHEADALTRLTRHEWDFLVRNADGWSLTRGPQDLELVAHALRCVLQLDEARSFAAEFDGLAGVQRDDGGFAPRSDGEESAVWVSAFCGLMLIRANPVLHDERVARAVRRAIDYFLASQRGDGRWVDPRWADLDTTSHPVSFFNVALAFGEPHRRPEVERSRRAGLGFLLGAQAEDGGWTDHEFHPSGVEITAHLIQDALVADLILDDRVGVARACARGLARLARAQAESGSWDDENVDHTLDCVRSSMLVARVLAQRAPEALAVLGAAADLRWIERGFAWILAVKNDEGWGDFPRQATNLERTCDGVDTLVKYAAYRRQDPTAIARLWGYAR